MKTLGDKIISSPHNLIRKIKNKIKIFSDEIFCQQIKRLVTKTLGDKIISSPHSLIRKIKKKIKILSDEIFCQQIKRLVTKILGDETCASQIGFFLWFYKIIR
jgi:hypothetical protein